jgi:hypothetical protein
MPVPSVVVGAAFGVPNDGDFIVGLSLVGGADLIGTGFSTVNCTMSVTGVQLPCCSIVA